MRKDVLVHNVVMNISDEFHKRLQKKTGWGKNQVFEEFKSSVINVLSKIVDEQAEKDDNKLFG